MVSFIFSFLISQSIYAAPSHTVEVVKGTVMMGTKKLAKGTEIKPSAKIEVIKDAVIFVRLGGSRKLLRLSGPGNFQILDENGAEVLGMYQGTVRVKSDPAKKDDSFRIKTSTAVVGIRGTDFFFSFQPLLAEAEVVVFDGEIEFTNASDPTDTKPIPKGYWGGVGGRYGKKIGELIQLPPNILSHFDKSLSWK